MLSISYLIKFLPKSYAKNISKKLFVDAVKQFSSAKHTNSPLFLPEKLILLKEECRALNLLFQRSGLTWEQQKRILSLFASDKKNPSRRSSDAKSGSRAQKAPPTSPGGAQSSGNDPSGQPGGDDNDKIPPLLAKAFLWMLAIYMGIAIVSLMFPSSNQPELIRYVSWNEFVYQMLAKGEVKEIIVRPELDLVTILLHEGAIINGKRSDVLTYHMNIVDVNKFEEKLRAAEAAIGVGAGGGVTVVYDRDGDAAGRLLASIIIAAIILSLLSRARTAVRSGPLSMDRFSQLGQAKFTLIDPGVGGKGVRFSDVAGLKEAKVEVMEIVDYLKRPDHYKLLGAKVPRGALLLGPPGCGKTLLAKAVATEANVPFLSMNGSEFIEMIGGLGAARVRDLFKEGRRRAPCIIYIDEIDALGRKRSASAGAMDSAGGEGEQTLNQLLVEMDGMMSKEGVLMLASTNRADVLDKALLRPGRFDRHILIDLPNIDERTEIFMYHLNKVTLEEPPTTYARRLAYLTPGFSGADIANVVNESALHAARLLKARVDAADLEYAVERVVGGTEKRSGTMSVDEKGVVAVHEAGHALASWLLPDSDVLLKVSIVPRTNLALGFSQYTPSDLKLYSKEQLYGKMCMALGGRAAEALQFNKITTQAEKDLEKVTKIAFAMIREYGMSKEVGLLSFPPKDTNSGISPYSKSLASLMDMEASKIVGKAYKQVQDLLQRNMDKLNLIAAQLLEKETLNYSDLEKLLGPPMHGKRRLIDPVEFEASLREFDAPPPVADPLPPTPTPLGTPAED